MNDIVLKAVNDAEKAPLAYTKFITPNDTGDTGAHQSGYHIHKDAWPLFFTSPGEKGENKDVFITIKWQNDFETDSRAIYYGKETRNEYRLTRFGRNFPFLSSENVGDLLIICKISDEYYKAYVLSNDEDIETFLSSIGIDITGTNRILLNNKLPPPEVVLLNLIDQLVGNNVQQFPNSKFISESAQFIHMKSWNVAEPQIIKEPDQILVDWIGVEYELFKTYESRFYKQIISTGFDSVEDLILLANTLLNRRKSRAGRSLENHLSTIFSINQLKYESQVKTEGNKRPDFIFPNADAYHNAKFDTRNLFFLAAKTTCKDRWRQILNEADRIKYKHLITLQQGISKNQLDEMSENNVILVVPDLYKSSFPKENRKSILSLSQFISGIRDSQKG